MIRAKDVRVGNWLLRDGKPVKITAIDIKRIESLKNLSGYEGIPMTGEFLVKNGFAFNRDEDSYDIGDFGDSMGLLTISSNDWSFAFLGNHEEIGWAAQAKLDQVHKFQNLMSSLSEKEVEIKL